MRAYTPKIVSPTGVGEVDPAPVAKEVVQKNNKVKGEYSSLGFWGFLIVVFIGWGFIVAKNVKLRDAIQAGNIRANVYNLVVIGLGAVIFINGFKVLLVKVGALRIPLISPLAERLLPLFQL